MFNRGGYRTSQNSGPAHPYPEPISRGQMQDKSQARTLVLGLGNLLLQDEGVGIPAALELSRRALPLRVDVVDGGTAGLDIIDLMASYERVIIVDAMDAGQEPGTVLRFSPQEVESQGEALALSKHQTEVLKILQLASYIGRLPPRVTIFGIQPGSMEWSTDLSPGLRGKLSTIVDAILDDLG